MYSDNVEVEAISETSKAALLLLCVSQTTQPPAVIAGQVVTERNVSLLLSSGTRP
jgi:hypothetical protein